MNVWKYLFLSTSSAQFQDTASIVIAHSQPKISDGVLFFSGSDNTSPYSLYFFKVTFGKSLMDWTNKLLWNFGSWSAYNNFNSLMSSDGSKIYSFPIYGSPVSTYFVTFNTIDGTVLGSRYKSSIGWSYVYKGAEGMGYISLSVTCSSIHLILIDTKTYTFIIKQSVNSLMATTFELFSGR